jgi:hypothetical protein
MMNREKLGFAARSLVHYRVREHGVMVNLVIVTGIAPLLFMPIIPSVKTGKEWLGKSQSNIARTLGSDRRTLIH